MNVLNRLIVSLLPAVPKPIIRKFASRYIAGEELTDAVRVVRELNAMGAVATLDVLGEDIHQRSEAIESQSAILAVFDAIEREKLDSNVSIKLTQVGLKLDRQFCLETMRVIADKAASIGNFVRIDMEDSSCTDDTLWVYRELRKTHQNIGIVLQAYMRRTQADADALIREGLGNFRLCKGIYIEPAEIAYKERSEINRNFMAVVRSMLEKKAYVGIATHDGELVDASYALLASMGTTKSAYEFQMLLGVRPELRDRILRDGHRIRVYVPFGARWYQYSIRRFKENPQVAGHVLKSLLSRLFS
jgi:proline dehydrogenase